MQITNIPALYALFFAPPVMAQCLPLDGRNILTYNVLDGKLRGLDLLALESMDRVSVRAKLQNCNEFDNSGQISADKKVCKTFGALLSR